MPTNTTGYRALPKITEREYEVGGHAPDTAQTEQVGDGARARQRTITIRPHKLTLRTRHPADQATTITDVVVEGRMVRVDGELSSARRQHLYAATGWGSEHPLPGWVQDIIAAEGLRYGDE